MEISSANNEKNKALDLISKCPGRNKENRFKGGLSAF